MMLLGKIINKTVKVLSHENADDNLVVYANILNNESLKCEFEHQQV